MRRPKPVRQALFRYLVLGVAAVVLVGLLGAWLARRAGEAEAIRDAKAQVHLAKDGSIEPALTDALVRGDPKALDAFDRVVKERVLNDPSIARIKLWDRSGRIVYSDEPAPDRRSLPGRAARTLSVPQRSRAGRGQPTSAEPENRFERGQKQAARGLRADPRAGRAPVALRDLLSATSRSRGGAVCRRAFVPALLGALLLLQLVSSAAGPLEGPAVRAARRAARRLLRRAIESSDLERRRIAARSARRLVQDLRRGLRSRSRPAAEGAPRPRGGAARRRDGDSPRGSGVADAARRDLSARASPAPGWRPRSATCWPPRRARGRTCHEVPSASLEPDTEALLFRASQEAVRNAVKHGGPSHVRRRSAREDGLAGSW